MAYRFRKGWIQAEYARQGVQGREDELRIDLVCGISPNHVQHGKLPTRMFVEPVVELQHHLFFYNDDMTSSN